MARRCIRLIALVVAVVVVVGIGVPVAGAQPLPVVAGVGSVVRADPGMYAGGTSQPDRTLLGVGFRVSGTQLRSEVVDWRAACRSGKTLIGGTTFGLLRIVDGGWVSRPASYVYRLSRSAYPSSGSVDLHARVIENAGQFTGPISATGAFRLSAVLYQHRTKIDSCVTGAVKWEAGTIASGVSSPLILPSGSQVGGLTYAEWEAKAWQWDLSNVRSHHSLAPSTVACVTGGQQAPVWFLNSDVYDFGHSFTIVCNVPAGDYVFIEYPSVECSTVESRPFHATTDAGLVRCARSFAPVKSSLAFDGQVLSPSGFVVSTGAFSFTMPATHNFLEISGKTGGRAAAYGQGLMVGPLTPGTHSIVRVSKYRDLPIRAVTFQLKVS